MKLNMVILAGAVAILAAVQSCWAGDVLDRIVATVNGHIILQSDWEDELRYEAFVGGRALRQFPAAQRKAALDRLIDQELLQEQMHSSDFVHSSEPELLQRLQEIRKQYAEAASEQGWQALLGHYGFTEEGLKRHVSLQLDLARLVDARLRPGVSIDSGSIERYYNQELLPQLRESGAKAVSLAEVSPKIKELLTQEKVNQLLVAWLQTLRSGSEIQTAIPSDSEDELR